MVKMVNILCYIQFTTIGKKEGRKRGWEGGREEGRKEDRHQVSVILIFEC